MDIERQRVQDDLRGIVGGDVLCARDRLLEVLALARALLARLLDRLLEPRDLGAGAGVARLQERLYEMNPPALRDQVYADLGRVYKYDAEFKPLDLADKDRMAFIVRVTVRWDENSSHHNETFSTILLRRFAR